MASYSVNAAGVAHADELIAARQYVLDSDWGDVQPRADEQNAYLDGHSWEQYAAWHLGLTDGPSDRRRRGTRLSSAISGGSIARRSSPASTRVGMAAQGHRVGRARSAAAPGRRCRNQVRLAGAVQLAACLRAA